MTASPRVALMITCLADMFYPEVGERIVRLLRRLGVTVTLPAGQTCCGLPLFNSGYHAEAAAVARRTVAAFADAELPLDPLPLTVTYHDPCHLAHGQRVRAAPRALLAKIPGLTVVPLADSELCCGSAGIYNILEPEMAEQLLTQKIDRIVATGARTVVTGNPGCLMQIAGGCRRRGVDIEVIHPVTLLARAVRWEAS